jgi:DNA-directed RNA polymerase subunit E'/Rpb7
MLFKCSVNLDPIHLDKNIKKQILTVIKETYEKKCSEYGYINKINKINQISEGTIYDCDLSGNISFDLDIDANIINYNMGDHVVCKVSSIDENIGAIISNKIKYPSDKIFHKHLVFVLFLIINDDTLKVNIGDNINVEIVARKVDVIENQIHLIGKLI